MVILYYKSSPEDFIVTEIDSDGKMVTLDPYSELPSKPAPVLPSEDEVERPRKGARPVTSEVPPLEHLVTPEQHQSIQELAETYKTSLNPHPKQNILLGWLHILNLTTILFSYSTTSRFVF